MIALAVVAAWIACGVLGSELGRRWINRAGPSYSNSTWGNDSFLTGMALLGPINLASVLIAKVLI